MEVRLQVRPTMGVQTHAHVVEAEAAPALLLGPVHSHVGILDQPFGGLARREGGDAHGGTAQQAFALHHQRLHQPGDQALRQLLHGGRIGLRQHHQELIAPQASHQMVGLHQLSQPGGEGNEQVIAHRVAVGVIDDFELIEIDKQHRAGSGIAPK